MIDFIGVSYNPFDNNPMLEILSREGEYCQEIRNLNNGNGFRTC